jgi:outer membrane protein
MKDKIHAYPKWMLMLLLFVGLWHSLEVTGQVLDKPDLHRCSVPDVKELPLGAAVMLAVCGSPEIRGAKFGEASQMAAVEESKGAFLPSLSLSLQQGYQNDRTRVESNALYDTNLEGRLSTATLQGNWLLFDFGSREAALQSARSQLDSAHANVDDVTMQFVADVVDSYRAEQFSAATVRVDTEYVENLKDALESVQARVKSGAALITEEHQVHSEKIQSDIELTTASNDELLARTKLARLVGYTGVRSSIISPLEEAVSEAARMESRSDIIDLDLLIQNQPKHLQATAARDAARAAVRQVKAAALPSLGLNGTATIGNQPVTPQLGYPAVGAHTRNLTAAVVLNIPLFSGYSQYYAVEKAEADLKQKIEDVDSSDRELRIDIEICFANMVAKRALVSKTQLILDNARMGASGSSARYRAGVASVNELIASAGTLVAAKRSVLKAEFELLNTRTKCSRSIADYGDY